MSAVFQHSTATTVATSWLGSGLLHTVQEVETCALAQRTSCSCYHEVPRADSTL